MCKKFLSLYFGQECLKVRFRTSLICLLTSEGVEFHSQGAKMKAGQIMLILKEFARHVILLPNLNSSYIFYLEISINLRLNYSMRHKISRKEFMN